MSPFIFDLDTLLCERSAGWKGASTALAVGTLVPALIAVALGAAYVFYVDHPLAQEAMQVHALGHLPCSHGRS